MKRIRTSRELIERATNGGWLRELVFYYQVKDKYTNSCLYNYRSHVEDICKILGISRRSFYYYINTLKRAGLIREHHSNLVFNSIGDYCNGGRSYHIEIPDGSAHRDIKYLLYSKILEHKAGCQAYCEEFRRYHEEDDHRKCTNGENPFQATMSYRTIARHLNVSVKSAYVIIKRLNEIGVLKTVVQRPYVIDKSGIPAKYFPEDGTELGYRFQVDGWLYEQMGSLHSFIHNPISLPKQSIRRYKKLKKSFVQCG